MILALLCDWRSNSFIISLLVYSKKMLVTSLGKYWWAVSLYQLYGNEFWPLDVASCTSASSTALTHFAPFPLTHWYVCTALKCSVNLAADPRGVSTLAEQSASGFISSETGRRDCKKSKYIRSERVAAVWAWLADLPDWFQVCCSCTVGLIGKVLVVRWCQSKLFTVSNCFTWVRM